MIKVSAKLFFWALIGCAAIAFSATQFLVLAEDAPPQRTASLPRSTPVPVSEPVDFYRDVQPIFVKHCYACHGASQARSGLRLDLRDRAFTGGDSGPVIVKGRSGDSLLIQYVTGQNDADVVMPPKGKAPPVTSQEIALLQRWIDQGAVWPSLPGGPPQEAASTAGNATGSTGPAVLSEHWAFRPVRHVKPPVSRDPWIDTPIDAFVLEKMQQHHLSPNPEASRIDLIRRVTFDLIGLPPTAEAVQSFLKDKSDDAYERLVDRLLDSRHYGERWARHWLDLARYADSDGFEDDRDRPFAYKYRDYVIRSFNNDKPYNQFLLEQLAGDEIDAGNPENLVALGFLRNGPTITNQHNEKIRVDEVDDMVSTTGAVCLGITVGCARCHDHKYEPISQRDYYRLFAVFDNAEKVDDKEIMQVRDPASPPHKTYVMLGGDCNRPGTEVQPGVPAVLDNSNSAFPASTSAPDGGAGRRLALADWIVDPDNPLTARVIVNRLWMYHFGRGLVNSPSNLGLSGEAPTHPELLDYLAEELLRNEWKLKRLQKMIVMSATYRQSSAYDPVKAGLDSAGEWYWRYPLRRLDAESIRDAMLVASGNLNLHMLGPGIRPKIPESIAAGGSKDKWPQIEQDGPEEWRRSVYIFVKRSMMVPMLEGFDAPSSTQTCERRLTTTVSTQALVLLNDEFSNRQAEAMAARVIGEVGDDLNRQVERAYWLALSRPPTEDQRRMGARFVEQRFQAGRRQVLDQRVNMETNIQAELRRRALADLCHVLFNSNEFVYVN